SFKLRVDVAREKKVVRKASPTRGIQTKIDMDYKGSQFTGVIAQKSRITRTYKEALISGDTGLKRDP
ncbi:hypothetical protein Ancab_033618, partial [Ancistrocladus abbreviatus]